MNSKRLLPALFLALVVLSSGCSSLRPAPLDSYTEARKQEQEAQRVADQNMGWLSFIHCALGFGGSFVNR